MKSWRKRVIKTMNRLFPGEVGSVLPIVLRWIKGRAGALVRRRGLVRGSALLWPYAGRAIVISVDLPRPAPDEVLVEVARSVISPGTERASFARMPNAAGKFPAFPGYSAAGEVIAAGGRAQFRPGDRVALKVEHGSVAVAKASEVVAIPEGVTLDDAAFVQLGVIVLQAIHKAPLRAGEPVVVLGHGLIGQLMVQVIGAFGASPVISVSRTARRLTQPLLRAAQEVIILDRDGPDRVRELDAAVTFEVTGSPDAIPMAIECTRRGGWIVLAGSTRGVTRRTDLGLLADKAITIVGAHITSLPDAAWTSYARAFLTLLEQRRLEVAPLITARIHPYEAERFYRALARADDTTIGAVFCWDMLSPMERLSRVWFFTPPDSSPIRGGRMVMKPLSERMERSQEAMG